MVAVIGVATRLAHVMINRIGMGEALDRMLSVPKGEHRRRQRKAQRRKRCERGRQPQPDSLPQCRQHRAWLLLVPAN
jgi:hypothetical protein